MTAANEGRDTVVVGGESILVAAVAAGLAVVVVGSSDAKRLKAVLTATPAPVVVDAGESLMVAEGPLLPVVEECSALVMAAAALDLALANPELTVELAPLAMGVTIATFLGVDFLVEDLVALLHVGFSEIRGNTSSLCSISLWRRLTIGVNGMLTTTFIISVLYYNI